MSIDIRATVQIHDQLISSVLTAHVLTGCDTVSYLWGTGKGTVVNKLKGGYQLKKLGDLETYILDVISEATFLFAGCYGSMDKDCNTFCCFVSEDGKNAHCSPRAQKSFIDHSCFQCTCTQGTFTSCNMTCCGGSWPTNGWIHTMSSTPRYQASPDDVLKMIRCGCSSTRPCATARCSCSAHVQCFVAAMVQKTVVMSTHNRLPHPMRGKTNELRFWEHIILCSSSNVSE